MNLIINLITPLNNTVVALPEPAKDDAIYAFICSLKIYLMGFIKAQIQVITDVSLNKIITVVLKLEENI